jgi:ABC-type dipeptide/oligopeptide/nickel transport system permease component
VQAVQKVGRGIKRLFANETFLYIIKRIGRSIITLVLLIIIVISLIRAIPDNQLYDLGTYNRLAGQNQNAADAYKAKQLFKYGRYDFEGNPVSVFSTIGQYLYWMSPIPKEVPIAWDLNWEEPIDFWKGTIFLGISMDTYQPVGEMLKERIGISMLISLTSVFFIYLTSYPLGVAMSKKPGGWVDKIGSAFIVLNYAIPALVFFLLMNNILGRPDGPFGWAGFSYFFQEDKPITLFPAIFSIVFLSIPGTSLWVRRFMVDELSSDYVRFARSKGLSENRILYTHVLKNAMIPLIRNIPAVFITSIIGSYFVEMIWSIPGTGNLMISALRAQRPNVPVIQGLTVIYSLLSMTAFLLGDIVTALYDPRVKLVHKKGDF